ncbi:unnamed protein product [Owenia fusiformis]|uniref:UspA domain-containing protein n=1 Tax=Owenia fusiformis TaxID=6347 RepID=A0A8S4PA17_OWEFU|nr:unnamed protein product [Owenia fusiformis]
MSEAAPVQEKIVVIPVDDSTHADDALTWYLEHIHREEFYVVVVHCFDVSLSLYGAYHSRKYAEAVHVVLEEEKARMNELIQRYKTKLESTMARHAIKGRVTSLSGKAGEAIVKFAKEENATMIVMGSRGLGAVRRTILGSVSDYVLHHFKGPVLIIPKQTKQMEISNKECDAKMINL